MAAGLPFGKPADPPVMYDRLCSVASPSALALLPATFTLPYPLNSYAIPSWGKSPVLFLRCEEFSPCPGRGRAFLLWPLAIRSWRLTQIDTFQVPTNRFVRHLHSASIVKSHNLLNRMIATDTAEQDTPLPCQAMRGVDLSPIDLKVTSSDPDQFWVPTYRAFKSRGYANTFSRL